MTHPLVTSSPREPQTQNKKLFFQSQLVDLLAYLDCKEMVY